MGIKTLVMQWYNSLEQCHFPVIIKVINFKALVLVIGSVCGIGMQLLSLHGYTWNKRQFSESMQSLVNLIRNHKLKDVSLIRLVN